MLELNLLVLQTSVSILIWPFQTPDDNACQICDYSLETVSRESVLRILHSGIVRMSKMFVGEIFNPVIW